MDYRVRGFTRDIKGKSTTSTTRSIRSRDYLAKNVKSRYEMLDVNVYQKTCSTPRCTSKEFDLDNYLFEEKAKNLSFKDRMKVEARLRARSRALPRPQPGGPPIPPFLLPPAGEGVENRMRAGRRKPASPVGSEPSGHRLHQLRGGRHQAGIGCGAASPRRLRRGRRGGPRRPSSPQDGAAAQVGVGQGLEVFADVGLDLALGLDHEAQVPAVAAQPGQRPMAKLPAYHSGLSRLGRLSSSRRRSPHQARWSVFLAGGQQLVAGRRVAGDRGRWPLYSAWAQTSPTWLIRIRPAAWRRSDRPAPPRPYPRPGSGAGDGLAGDAVPSALGPRSAGGRTHRRRGRRAWPHSSRGRGRLAAGQGAAIIPPFAPPNAW